MRGLYPKLWLAFSLVVCIACPCNKAGSCIGGPEWSDSRMVFFNPELGEDSLGLRPFFYSAQLFFPNDYDGFTHEGRSNTTNDYRRNCREWQQYLGGKTDLHDIYQVVYDSNADTFLTALATRSLADFFPGNTFIKALLKPERQAALEYLNFAKKFEFEQFTYKSDPWSDEYRYSWQRDSSALERLAAEARGKLAGAREPFLQKRWAYQVINTGYYATGGVSRDSLLRVFDRYFNSGRDNSILMPWALLKIAEMTPDTALANYRFARVFDLCQSKRIRALQLFRSASAEAALQYAQSPAEKATILAVRAMQNPGRGLDDLRRIAALCPTSAFLPLLLTREINKVEDWLLGARLSGLNPWVSFAPEYEWDENYEPKMNQWRRINAQKDRIYVQDLRLFLEGCIREKTRFATLLPLLRLAVSHVYFIEKQYRKAWNVLQQVQSVSDKRLLLQKNIAELLLLPHLRDVARPSTRDELARRLSYARQNARLLSEPDIQLGRIYLALSHAFFEKKDIARAGLLFGRGALNSATRTEHWWSETSAASFYDNLASIRDMEQLEQMLNSNNKSAFDEFITGPYQAVEITEIRSEWDYFKSDRERQTPVPTPDRIHDLKGTLAFRDGRLSLAWRELAQVDTGYWAMEFRTWDLDFCGSANLIAADTLPPLAGNNKARLIKQMLDLETEAAKNPDKRALNYYLLGNAWFHCSYWGRASGAFAPGKSIDDTDRPDPYRRGPAYLSNQPDPKRYGGVYYRCQRAARYFRLALDHRPDPELAARAFYMLAECDRRDRWMSARRMGENSPVKEGDVASPYFKAWAKQYGNTAAYRRCVDSCPGLKEYLGL